MSACVVCPPLACNAGCETSKQPASKQRHPRSSDDEEELAHLERVKTHREQLVSSLKQAASESDPEVATIDSHAATGTSTSNVDPNRPQMQQLPNEIKDHIVSYLQPDLETIRNIRLVSKDFAFVGSHYLLDSTFTALPHRDDFERLAELAQHPYFSQQIKTLNIRWMGINEESLRLSLIAPTRGSPYEEESFRTSWAQYRKMKGRIDCYSDTFCSAGLLTDVFRGLTQLTELNINPNSYIFETVPRNTYLYDSWRALMRDGTSLQRYHEATENRRHYHRILTALANVKPASLRTISLSPFCRNMLVVDLEDSMTPVLQNLKCFKLNVQWRNQTDRDLEHQFIGDFLSKASNVEELHITLPRSYELDNALPTALQGRVFQKLHTLVLDNDFWQLSSVQEFLFNHRETLRRVRLAFPARVIADEWQRGTRSLMEMMRKKMQIEKLDYLDDLGEYIGEYTATSRASGMYDEKWNLLPDYVADPDMMCYKRQIEDYVIRRGERPDMGRFGVDYEEY